MKKLLLLLLVCTGCSFNISPGGDGVTHYDLGTVSQMTVSSKERDIPDVSLLVAPMIGPTFLSGQRITFAESDGRVGSYQFSLWSESPIKRLTTLLNSVLSSKGVARRVARMTGVTRGDYLIQTELLKFAHNVAETPYRAQVVIRAEVIAMRDGRILSQETFVEDVKTSGSDAEDAVTGFNEASDKILSRIADWVADVIKPQLAPLSS